MTAQADRAAAGLRALAELLPGMVEAWGELAPLARESVATEGYVDDAVGECADRGDVADLERGLADAEADLARLDKALATLAQRVEAGPGPGLVARLVEAERRLERLEQPGWLRRCWAWIRRGVAR